MTPLSNTIECRYLELSDEAGLALLYGETDGPSLPFLLSLMSKPSGVAWCSFLGERVIAVVWLNVIGNEAEIIDFRVHTSMRRQGVGHVLLRDTLNALTLRSVDRVFLEVRRSNVAAITLYERAGFATIGTRDNYYETASGREDALLMRHDSNKR